MHIIFDYVLFLSEAGVQSYSVTAPVSNEGGLAQPESCLKCACRKTHKIFLFQKYTEYI